MRENTNGPLPWQEEFWRCQSSWPVLWEQMIASCYFQILLMTTALWNPFFFFYLFPAFSSPLDRRVKEKKTFQCIKNLSCKSGSVTLELFKCLPGSWLTFLKVRNIDTRTDHAVKWCWVFRIMFLFVSAGCVQLVSPASLRCVQLSWQRVSQLILKY